MASPTAKLKGSKTRIFLIRFVGDAFTLITRSTPKASNIQKPRQQPDSVVKKITIVSTPTREQLVNVIYSKRTNKFDFYST